METVHESVRHFLDSPDIALTKRTPSSRGGFNRLVTCVFPKILRDSYPIFIGHWTRSSRLPLATIYGTDLLVSVEYNF